MNAAPSPCASRGAYASVARARSQTSRGTAWYSHLWAGADRALTARSLRANVDAAVLRPPLFVVPRRVERPARGLAHAVVVDAQAVEVLVRGRGAGGAERHVVFLLAARIGPADELDVLPLERAVGHAFGDLLEDVAIGRRELRRVE